MDSTHKYCTKNDPEECRQPSPIDCDAGTDDRGSASNRCEMVTKKNIFFRGNKIDAIFKFFRWGRTIELLETKNSICNEFGIKPITKEKKNKPG